MITNADQGILLTGEHESADCISLKNFAPVMAITTGTSASLVSAPQLPGWDFWWGPPIPVLQAQDGSFVGEYLDPNTNNNDMIAFDAAGNIRWTVPNETPQIAAADGGVIGKSGITYDQNGNATGQVSQLTYSWTSNAYQLGSVEQVLARPIYAALGFWSFFGGNSSGNSTAVNQQWFPPLASCTDNGGNCQGPLGPRDFLWNARNDLVSQLTPNSACSNAAQSYVFSKFTNGDTYGKLITRASSVDYVRNNIGFYDGSKSTLDMSYALCPPGHTRFLCPGSTQTVKQTFEDTSEPTAVTVSPSHPFKSFWQSTFKPAGKDDHGFGVGINPSNYSVNIYNESILLHEALHGMTGLYDSELETALGVLPPSLNISIYIMDNVLSGCPTFAQGGH